MYNIEAKLFFRLEHILQIVQSHARQAQSSTLGKKEQVDESADDDWRFCSYKKMRNNAPLRGQNEEKKNEEKNKSADDDWRFCSYKKMLNKALLRNCIAMQRREEKIWQVSTDRDEIVLNKLSIKLPNSAFPCSEKMEEKKIEEKLN